MDDRIVQSLMLENKEKLNITGVECVESFNDETVVLLTNKGKLTVKGKKFAISKLNVEEGKLMVSGDINAMIYSEKDSPKEKVSLIKKIFK